jgi:hypothetical protein
MVPHTKLTMAFPLNSFGLAQLIDLLGFIGVGSHAPTPERSRCSRRKADRESTFG